MTSPTHRELAAMAREFNGRADDCGRLARAVLAALEQQAVPDGCTPQDAQVLRQANHALAGENYQLRQALRFYAAREHFNLSDRDAWDTVSGEPQNWWCDDAGTATVEDGSIAAMALRGEAIHWDDEDGHGEPPVCPGEPEDRISAPTPDASEPAQAEAPSEREAFEQHVTEGGKFPGCAQCDVDGNYTNPLTHPARRAWLAALRYAALATQQAVQGEPVGEVMNDVGRLYVQFTKPLSLLGEGAKLYATPGQVERDGEDAENWRWLTEDCDGDAQDDFIRWLSGNVASKADIDARVKAIRTARSSEGGGNEHSR